MLLPIPIGGPYPKPPIPMFGMFVLLGINMFPAFIPNGLNPIGFSASFSACSFSFFSLF
jgi:hypothetical protein